MTKRNDAQYKITNAADMRVKEVPLDPPHPGNLIREELDYAGLSIPKAAERMGLNRANLNNVCLGKASVSRQLAYRLEALLADGLADLLIAWQQAYDVAQEREERAAFRQTIERVSA